MVEWETHSPGIRGNIGYPDGTPFSLQRTDQPKPNRRVIHLA